MRYRVLESLYIGKNPLEQFLYARGMKPEEINTYLHTTDECINDYNTFGKDNLWAATHELVSTISSNKTAILVVDCDCDGYTSAAILMNYLHKIFPAWVENNLSYFIHSGKQHGLSDCIDYIIDNNFDLVLLPDSSSNDYEYHARLKGVGITPIILDHHEAEKVSENAIVINNQLSNYPNKFLSGAGVVWQFCRYIDSILNVNYANDFLDLVAVGLQGDMMSMLSTETKHLIWMGLRKENIKNPFIYEIIKKNNYSLTKGDYISYQGLAATPMGASFFIVPFVNAIVRSGTLEEKDLIFRSMLDYKAFEMIPSNKRGHKLGDMERVVDQAMRTITNVKNRQTKAQDAGMELLEGMIERDNMMEKHKVLLFLLEPGQIDRNIAGLCANKIMAKHQRPVCVLTRVVEMTGGEMIPFKDGILEKKYEPTEMKVSYQGSARGYDKSGITNFKDICAGCDQTLYSAGHQGAFGLGLPETGVAAFLDYTDEILQNMQSEPIYYVDYDFDESEIDIGEKILALAELNDYIGKDIDRPYIMISFTITSSNFTVMKSNTLKFTLPNGINIIKFGGTEEEIKNFTTSGAIKINAVCKCNKNEWNGNVYPQLLIEEYEIVSQSKYLF